MTEAAASRNAAPHHHRLPRGRPSSVPAARDLSPGPARRWADHRPSRSAATWLSSCATAPLDREAARSSRRRCPRRPRADVATVCQRSVAINGSRPATLPATAVKRCQMGWLRWTNTGTGSLDNVVSGPTVAGLRDPHTLSSSFNCRSVPPPTTRTRPSGSSVALWSSRLGQQLLPGLKVSVVGFGVGRRRGGQPPMRARGHREGRSRSRPVSRASSSAPAGENYRGACVVVAGLRNWLPASDTATARRAPAATPAGARRASEAPFQHPALSSGPTIAVGDRP